MLIYVKIVAGETRKYLDLICVAVFESFKSFQYISFSGCIIVCCKAHVYAADAEPNLSLFVW